MAARSGPDENAGADPESGRIVERSGKQPGREGDRSDKNVGYASPPGDNVVAQAAPRRLGQGVTRKPTVSRTSSVPSLARSRTAYSPAASPASGTSTA